MPRKYIPPPLPPTPKYMHTCILEVCASSLKHAQQRVVYEKHWNKQTSSLQDFSFRFIVPPKVSTTPENKCLHRRESWKYERMYQRGITVLSCLWWVCLSLFLCGVCCVNVVMFVLGVCCVNIVIFVMGVCCVKLIIWSYFWSLCVVYSRLFLIALQDAILSGKSQVAAIYWGTLSTTW